MQTKGVLLVVHVKNTAKFLGWFVIILLLAGALPIGLKSIFSAFELNNDIPAFIFDLVGYVVSTALLIRLIKKKSTAAEDTADKLSCVFICVFFMAYPVAYYTFARLIFGGNSPFAPSYIEEYQSILGFVFSIVKNAMLIPVMEELLFRKLCFLQLENMNAAAKIFLSGILFAAAHLPSGFYIGDTVISGLLLAVIYFLTNNLFYCILAHSAHNLFAVVINRLNYERLIPWDYNLDLYVYPTWLSVLCIAAVIAAGTAFAVRYKKIKVHKIL